ADQAQVGPRRDQERGKRHGSNLRHNPHLRKPGTQTGHSSSGTMVQMAKAGKLQFSPAASGKKIR
ncbi:MAG TPA: hypothetical protein VIU64_17885, partial [Polyangia bacterium]